MIFRNNNSCYFSMKTYRQKSLHLERENTNPYHQPKILRTRPLETKKYRYSTGAIYSE